MSNDDRFRQQRLRCRGAAVELGQNRVVRAQLHVYRFLEKRKVLDNVIRCDNTLDVDVREIIRNELRRRDWSQRELCRRTGMLPHQLCGYLNGRRDLYVETLQGILAVLGLEIRPTSRRRKRR